MNKVGAYRTKLGQTTKSEVVNRSHLLHLIFSLLTQSVVLSTVWDD